MSNPEPNKIIFSMVDGTPASLPAKTAEESDSVRDDDGRDLEPRGWYSRGYLPHFDAGESRTQFITCRLYDSLPQNILTSIAEEIELRKPENISRETFILAEKYLDNGYGQCFLGKRAVAEVIRDTLQKFDGEKYKLHAWVVMPNHIMF